jgi:hypothetical protein
MDTVKQIVDLLRVKVGRFFWQHFASEWRRANHYLAKTDCLYEKLIGEAEKAGKLAEADDLFAEWQAKRQSEILEVERLETIYLSEDGKVPHRNSSSCRCRSLACNRREVDGAAQGIVS